VGGSFIVSSSGGVTPAWCSSARAFAWSKGLIAVVSM
jgi:hypothetical protein